MILMITANHCNISVSISASLPPKKIEKWTQYLYFLSSLSTICKQTQLTNVRPYFITEQASADSPLVTLIKEAITKCNASNIYHKGSDNADRQQWNYFSKHVRHRWNNPKFFFLPPFLSWCVCWISQIGANYDLDRGWRNAQTASCAFCLSSHPIWKHPGNSLAALTTPASIFQINANTNLSGTK